jgi:hypothetical protein
VDELDVSQEMIRLALTLPMVVFATGCLGTDCENEQSAEIVSPNGTKKIVLFSRNCGATTGFNLQGSILNQTEDLPNEAGTAFIAAENTAKIIWQDDTKLVVTFEPGVEVFKKATSCRGVAIEYR